ncbi:MAG: hypothetical protein KJ831_04595 [Candidatus Eisenbacteria bacterium]|nr:hypothetical protein [Candidatus Eisenbacteria bacterium]
MPRFISLGFLILCVVLGSAAAADEIYNQARLDLTVPGIDLMDISSFDLEIIRNEGDALVIVARSSVIEEMVRQGYKIDVEIEDLQSYYAARFEGRDNFGEFHTYSEAVTEINNLHNEYPDLTTAPISIGTTWEGNDIWAIKVSDNPDLEEDEPEVLFDGLHHAREIMTVEIVLHYARYLCEHYETDPLAAFLVDNRQIWFIPVVNPDGFLYNEQIAPNGGGMWRKNRRVNGGGCYGVDPNRNYTYEWGGTGTSPDPCDDTYKGPYAGSEPEIQAMMNFMIDHNFVTQNSYHSVAAAILHPWGYTAAECPEDDLFEAMGMEMASENGYIVGQPGETIGYSAAGTTFDWAYGEQTLKNKIYSFTTEVGGSGFWPTEAERVPLINENLYSNLYLTQVAGAYIRLTDIAVIGGDGNGRLDPGETADLVLTLESVGVLVGADNVQVTLKTDDPYIQLNDALSVFGLMDPGEIVVGAGDPCNITVHADAPGGHAVDFEIRITGQPGLDIIERATERVGLPPVLYLADFETDEGGWSQDPSHTAETGAFVRVDPNGTGFQPEDDTTPDPGVYAWITGQNSSEGTDDVDGGTSASQSPIWNLSAVTEAQVRLNYFHGQRDYGDDSGDFFRIDLSNDGGATYPVNLVFVGDITHQANWIEFSADLGSEIPLTSQMRIRVQARDNNISGDIIEAGLDDVMIFEGDGNTPPSAPLLAAPADGSQNHPPQPTLEVYNSIDPDGDPLTYAFAIYHDELLTDLAVSMDGISEGAGTTAWIVSTPLAQGTYWWRAYAEDSSERGLYMQAASFTVGESSGLPDELSASKTLRLGLPSPNPMVSSTRIPYYIPSSARMDVSVVDVSGRHIARLFKGTVNQGWGSLSWDARDDDGRPVAAGFYWARVRLGDQEAATRLMVVR